MPLKLQLPPPLIPAGEKVWLAKAATNTIMTFGKPGAAILAFPVARALIPGPSDDESKLGFIASNVATAMLLGATLGALTGMAFPGARACAGTTRWAAIRAGAVDGAFGAPALAGAAMVLASTVLDSFTEDLPGWLLGDCRPPADDESQAKPARG